MNVSNLLTHPKDILWEQARYFQELYTSPQNSVSLMLILMILISNVVDQLVVDRLLSIDEFT